MNIFQWTVGAALLALSAAPAMAQQSMLTAFNYNLADGAAGATAPSEEPKADAPKSGCGCENSASCGCEEASCGCEPACGCEASCGCNGCSSCDSDCLGCLDDSWPFCCCCDLGDPCTLHSHLTPCCETTYGGWMQMGYHSDFTGLSQTEGDLLDFNDVPDDIRLQQAWAYVEKKAKTDGCSADWGYRADIVYGTDAQKTQAFGNDGGTWDVTFDNGIYGWALPQAYAELGWNDWSVKVGHFFTPIGYEVVPATGNFFYSHALMMFNSEPFTHTGVLGTYTASEATTLYAGWTLGWDTGFDQFDGGNNWLGGIGHKFGDSVTVTYLSTAGNLGFRSGGEEGYMQSVVAVVDLSEKNQYVMQSDYVHSDGFLGDPDRSNTDFGINQYLFHTINDCWKAGVRMEWWKSNGVVENDSISFYELTGGLNYKPHANVIIRPEFRYQWAPAEDAVGFDFNRDIFGIDAIFTF